MNMITVAVGTTRIETPNAVLARQVLEQSTGLAAMPELIAGELVIGLGAPAIGQYWHGQGGIYAGMVRGEDGTSDYHLIVPTDLAGQLEEIEWGGAGKNEPGATSARDGLANTRALFNSKHDHPAAQWATDLEIDGLRDWYLPARHELRLCYLNVPELFSTDGWYSSSTQHSPRYAWIQYFVDGSQYYAHKDTARRAVAVRRVVNP
ncbi:MAG: DUF1566 domain-containing protein [Pseudomonas sp.]